MPKSSLKEKIKKLSKTPGVYIFYGRASARGGFHKAQVLYVGKATSLRDRVKSYFVGFSPFGKGGLKGDLKNLDNLKIPLSFGHLPLEKGEKYERPVDYAISQIKDVKTIETDTVLEAFILEQDLIKKLQPKYNAMGKDDKSFTFAVITKEEFPRILLLRKTKLEKMNNSKSNIYQSSAFPLLAKARNSSRPKRLSVATAGAAKPSFSSLKTKNNKLKTDKIYGPYTSKKQIEIALKILRKIFPYHNKPQKTEKGCLDSQIGLCPGPYDGKITRKDYLKNIRGIRMVLEGKKKSLIRKLEKEMKEYSRNHEYEKAAETRNKIFALKHIRDVAMINSENFSAPQSSAFPLLAKARNSSKPSFSRAKNFRVEAYDISNISGQLAVGSMVVFDDKNGQIEPNKSEYRKFKIRTIQGADDVGMMREILTRRFKNNWPKPDLILLDGGKGQLYAGEFVLHKLNLKIPLVAVAKGEDRKKLDYNFSNFQQFSMSKFSDEIIKNRNLIKQIMDEAHRFAITYHKKIRRRNFIT